MNKKYFNISTRELHLIDIENETGKSNPTAAEIAQFRAFYCDRNNVPRDAHIVVAASSGPTLLEASVGWPGARTTFLPGLDGADLALIEVALGENVEQRFGKVVIASGDHIFAKAAMTLLGLGVKVTFFARAVYLSRFLRDTSATIRVFSAADFSLAA
jgi:hypothetical protein